jgi:hypothetical protein
MSDRQPWDRRDDNAAPDDGELSHRFEAPSSARKTANRRRSFLGAKMPPAFIEIEEKASAKIGRRLAFTALESARTPGAQSAKRWRFILSSLDSVEIDQHTNTMNI